MKSGLIIAIGLLIAAIYTAPDLEAKAAAHEAWFRENCSNKWKDYNPSIYTTTYPSGTVYTECMIELNGKTTPVANVTLGD
jgi:hypothetical protein